MAGAAGRHRVLPRAAPFADYRVGAFVPAARHRTGLGGRHRALALALTGLAVAAVLSGIALSGSSVTAAPGHPLLEWQPRPDVTFPGPLNTRTRGTAGPRHRLAKMQARSSPLTAAPPRTARPATARQQAARHQASRQQGARRRAVVVTYLVASQGPAGFQGEIQVTNNTGEPIGDWQIVVALDGDEVTSFSNAAGYVSNGILLLSPASPAQVAPPHGGVLDVFFVAEGTQTTPVACAFDGIPCGYIP